MTVVGMFGTFDLENLGDMLFPWIARNELARRVPRLELRTWAPVGYVGRNRFEEPGQEPASPLGAWSEERVSELADQLDLLLIGGGEIIHDRDWELAPHYGLPPEELSGRASHRFFVEGLGERERDVPTAWNAVGVPHDPDPVLSERLRSALADRSYVAVRDEVSLARLRSIGVERPIEIVPDSAFLVDRLLGPDDVAATVDVMREAGIYPEGDALVVQGSRPLLDHLPAIGEAVGAICEAHSLTPLLVETGPIHGDGLLADGLEALLPKALRLPPTAGMREVIAAIAWSAGFVGSSLHGNVIAAAFDRPGLVLDTASQSKLTGFVEMLEAPERSVSAPADLAVAFERVLAGGSVADTVGRLRAAVDVHFDRIAALATERDVARRAAQGPLRKPLGSSEERTRYERAAAALGARMAAQQASFADRERDLEGWIEAQAREIAEKDVRFTRMWRKIHEGDRHYHYHKGRADRADEQIAALEAENQRLRAILKRRQERWTNRYIRRPLGGLKRRLAGGSGGTST
jgi:hypothetical protein